MNIDWFKSVIHPKLTGYNIEYHSFGEGDFGTLERVEFEGNSKLGTIDFWSSGWLSLHVMDLTSEEEILNILLEPHQTKEKELYFDKLLKILG